jgi:hypothetical protein
MTNNIFMARNVFCPHKDYSSFLGGKLIVFKLCNSGLCWRRYDVIFRIVSSYCLVGEAYFVVGEIL